MISIRLPSVEAMLKASTLSTKQATDIKRKALRQMHGRVMRQSTRPDRTSDQFVAWNFRKRWEQEQLPLGTIAGSDYDYFDEAMQDCITLFHTWGFPGQVDPDKPGRFLFGPVEGDPKYNSMYEIFQNGVKVNSPHNLRGPWVDFGPTVDYALFLEKSKTKPTNNLNAPLLRGVGVLHAIADRLQVKYAGVHRIFAHVQQPKGAVALQRSARKAGRPSGNKDPSRGLDTVGLFPVIRIMHRHWKR